ncbi:MAG TPA: UxaA family hydrolase [Ferrovibrio sp.]|jgi:hypothetical protein|uniref:UxaA family hydrolase n=1 Tax=Ferrovibrio sp. TaxID=1917215 RepID=UPI002ED2EF20
MDARLLLLAAGDNVAVARQEIPADSLVMVAGRQVRLRQALGFGHKIAVKPIREGERIIKYGAPVGRASAAIALGDYVHHHNVRSEYLPNTRAVEAAS